MITRRMALQNSVAAGGAALVAWGVPALGRGAENIVTLHGAGSTFSAPLYRKWIEDYQRDHAQVSLIYDAVGSGEGVTRFTAGSIDFGATDVLPGDVVLAGARNGAIPVPVTAGMIVLAYNLPGLKGALRLPRDVYSGIFSGKITQWNDPAIQRANPGLALPKRDIAVVVRQDSSGTTAAFTRHLVVIGSGWHASGSGAGYDIDWPAAAMDGRGNEGVSSKIKISEGSIGYVEYGFAKRLGLQMATLENKAGRFVAPTEEGGRAALAASENFFTADPPGDAAYPITTFSWLLLHKKYADQKTADALKDWVNWGLTTGQTFASALGYIPLPAETATLARRTLDSLS